MWQAYRAQRNNANRRSIPWDFDYYKWLKFWSDSGHLEDRGRGKGKYCMARRGDEGPYSLENCYITKYEDNSGEPQVQAKAAETRAKRPDDWEPKKNFKHLRDVENHPKARRVVDTSGKTYASAAQAARHRGLTRQAVAHRCRTGLYGWHYQEEETA